MRAPITFFTAARIHWWKWTGCKLTDSASLFPIWTYKTVTYEVFFITLYRSFVRSFGCYKRTQHTFTHLYCANVLISRHNITCLQHTTSQSQTTHACDTVVFQFRVCAYIYIHYMLMLKCMQFYVKQVCGWNMDFVTKKTLSIRWNTVSFGCSPDTHRYVRYGMRISMIFHSSIQDAKC